jgi:hypothetical protein
MRRTLLASGVAGVVIALMWLNFENPVAAPLRAALLVVLAVAVVVLPGPRLRAVGSVVAVVLAIRLAFGMWLPLHPIGGTIGGADTVWSQFENGFLDFYSTHLPFDPGLHTDMAKVVLFAGFAFTLAVGLFAAARKPVAAAVLLLVGAGWPATLIVPTNGTVLGAAILGGALVVLVAAGSRRISAYAVPFTLALVLGGILVGSSTASSHPVINWQNWNVARGHGRNAVQFVWDAQYGGVQFPKIKTTMVTVSSNAEPAYLRAAVLDDFVNGRWVAGPPRAADALEPPAAFVPDNQRQQVVTIEGLADTHLLAGDVPVRFSAGLPFVEPQPGLAQLPSGYGRGFEYTAWSYAVSPSAEELSRSRATYPAALLDGGMLDVGGGVRVPPFGVLDRKKDVANSLSLGLGLPDYAPLARIADRVTRGTKTPYAATVALERWFLVKGGFTYSNQPTVVDPPLVGFVTSTHSGYCQYFAGAMALMLRYVGIPARVAVGFAGPSFDPVTGQWKFTDHDAHAWVEVWFKGYGWLPFDPTPAPRGSSRGKLISQYTHVPGTPSSGGSSGGGGHKTPPPPIVGTGVNRIHLGGRTKAGHTSVPAHGGGGVPFALIVVALVLAAVVGGLALAKQARRRVRRMGSDPRRIAAACRDELVSFLLDQGIESPPSATVRELGLLAQRQLGADIDEFVAATTEARFGRPEAATAAARVALRESGPFFASCRRFLSRQERLRGFFSLRSLTRVRWTVDGSAALGTTPP